VRLWKLALLGGLALSACVQDSEGNGAPADSAVEATLSDSISPESGGENGFDCTFVGTTCPQGCSEIGAQAYDPGGECFGPWESVLCLPAGASLDASTVVTCRIKTISGTLYRFPTSQAPIEPEVPGWTDCTETQYDKLNGSTCE